MDKFPRRHILVYAATIWWDIICWMIVAVLRVIAGKRLEWVNGLWVIIDDKSWFKKTFLEGYGGGTLGHGGWISEWCSGESGLDSQVEFHEHVHVEQYEFAMVDIAIVNAITLFASLIFGASYQVVLVAMLIQMFGGMTSILSSVIVTKLRGEHAYRGSSHEEAAYAREAIWRKERNL